ncbi:MAG: polysaccharide deacetylase family protein [Phycisphaerales bacterium]|nr:polysaccharide deacetylase family protein [Phycisphaerales bacterium]
MSTRSNNVTWAVIVSACVVAGALAVDRTLLSSRDQVLPGRAIAEVPILMYHRVDALPSDATRMYRRMTVSPDELRQHARWLRDEGFNTISFAQLDQYFRGEFTLPDKPIILSFDDAFDEHYLVVAPILTRFHLSATFFIHTDWIGQYNCLTWDQTRHLASAGFEIGSHTRTHPVLPALDDRSLRSELRESRSEIARQLGVSPMIVAYPFGENDERVQDAARSAGYSMAAGVRGGSFQRATERLNLRRIEIRNGDDTQTLKRLLGGTSRSAL